MRIRAGDRLRVAVAGCDWPTAWPPPVPVVLEVLGGHLLLPRPDGAAEVDPPAAPTPVSAPPLALAHDDVPATWELVHEAVAGVTRSRAASGWSNPAPARWRPQHRLDRDRGLDRGRRPGELPRRGPRHRDGAARRSSRRTRGHLVVHGDAEELHVTVELVVERDGAVIAERSFGASAPRDLL